MAAVAQWIGPQLPDRAWLDLQQLLEGRRQAFLYQYRASRRHFRAALERNPVAAEALVGLARAQIEASAFDEAQKNLRSAQAVGGPRADAWGALALLELSGRASNQRAWRFAERALELDPGEPVAHRVIGDLYRRDNKLEAMMYHYRLALLRDPHNLPINRFLIRAQLSAEELIAEEDLPAPPPRN